MFKGCSFISWSTWAWPKLKILSVLVLKSKMKAVSFHCNELVLGTISSNKFRYG